MDEFGVHLDYRFDILDWVGARYSMWSSIGVALAIAVGREHFLAFLAGAHSMDAHFRTAPGSENLPILIGLLGVWNINFLKLLTLAVLPYDDRLKPFSAYLQQLEMKSNGKSVMKDGKPVESETAPLVWGEPVNNAQHSFFQLLDPGTQRVAFDFPLPARFSSDNQDQQNLAIANCLAQAEVFLNGQSADVVRAADLEWPNLPPERLEPLIPQKVDQGSRPSAMVLLQRADAYTLGELVALYEHKVITQEVISGISSLYQWRGELGKRLAGQLIPIVRRPVQRQSCLGPGSEASLLQSRKLPSFLCQGRPPIKYNNELSRAEAPRWSDHLPPLYVQPTPGLRCPWTPL
jgi:glucose-6-phosphate isomerase